MFQSYENIRIILCRINKLIQGKIWNDSFRSLFEIIILSTTHQILAQINLMILGRKPPWTETCYHF